jgi:AraC-like DNA-binding protein
MSLAHPSAVLHKSSITDQIPTVPFPVGIPTYSLYHGLHRLKRGQSLLLLYHDWDVFMVVQGKATWTLTDGRTLVGSAGDFVILPPFTPAMVSESQAPMSFFYCHIAFRSVPVHLKSEAVRNGSGPGPEARLPLFISARKASEIARPYRRLQAIGSGGGHDWYSLERGALALGLALARYAEAFSRRAHRQASPDLNVPKTLADPRVLAVKARIDAAPCRPWRVAGLAASVGLSPTRLHVLFHSATGRSTKTYIIQSRLESALRLLAEPSRRSIAAVAESCGFSSQHFFSRQFRAHFALSPRAYRDGVAVT